MFRATHRDELYRGGIAPRATDASVLYYETITRLLNL